jgi:hypothetical protein
MGPAPISTGSTPPFAAGRIEVAAPDPTSTNIMYIGGDDGGIWKTSNWNQLSINGGPTWLPLTDNQPSLQFSGWGYHSLQVLRAGVVHPIFGLVSGPGAGVLKSFDAGQSWTEAIYPAFDGADLGSLAFPDPNNANPMTFYISVAGSSQGGGVFKTTDGGLTFQNTTSFHNGAASDVVVDPFNQQVLYAGLVGNSSTAGVWKSVNGGTAWTRLSGLPSGPSVGDTIRLEVAPSAQGTLYATVFVHDLVDNGQTPYHYVTTDSGQHWALLPNPAGDKETRFWHVVLAVDPRDASHVFVNTAYHLFESHDSGQHWSSFESIGDDWVNMAFDALDRPVATADRDVYASVIISGGGQFLDQRQGNLQVTEFYDITLDPQSADRAYGVAQDVAAMKFTDSRLWQYLPNGGGGETGKVLVDPANASLLYVSNPLDHANLVHRSTDGGNTWTTIFATNTIQDGDYALAYSTQKSFLMDPVSSSTLLIGTTRVFQTTNAQSPSPTWTPFSPVLSPSLNVADQYITALARSSDALATYAATADGHVWVKYSLQPWQEMDQGLFGHGAGAVVDIRVDPADRTRAYAVTNGPGGRNVWYLQGANGWVNISGNLPTDLGTDTIFADFQHAVPILYVGTWRGVYHSWDNGQHWVKLSRGLPSTEVKDLQYMPAQHILAAATYGRGVWEILIGVMAQVQNGTLNISGDDNPNVITIQANPDAAGLNVWEGNSSTPYYRLVGFFPAASFNQIVVNEGDGNDTVNIEDTLSGKPLTVNLGNGLDAVNVSPFAENLDHIQGNVTVNGGNGFDTLNINDQNKATNLTYTLANTTWSRPGAAVISSGTLFAAINRVVVNAGSGANVYNVINTTTATTLNTGPGQGTVNVQSTGIASPLTVDTPAGTSSSSQTVRVGNGGSVQLIGGALTIHNQPAYDTLLIDDSADGTNHTVPGVVISANGITGLAPAPINFTSFSISTLTVLGGTGSNSFTITGTPAAFSMALTTGAGTNTVNLQATSVTPTLTGNAAGINTLVGPNATTTWHINGTNLGNVAGGSAAANFSGYRNLTGGSLADTFIFSNGAGVTGTINGGGGSNALDYSAYATPVTVDLSGGTATGTGAIANLQSFTGGSAANTLKGPSAATTWSINSTNAGTLTGGFSFTAFQNLTGGAGPNTFVLANGAGVTGTINGGSSGANALSYAAYLTPVTVDLAGGTATGTGAIANLQSFTGGSAANTFKGPSAATTWNISAANVGTLTGGYSFTAFQNLTGGAGANTFVLASGAGVSGTLTGGGGSNALNYAAYTTPVTVDLSASTATGTGGIANLQSFTGGAATNTLKGPSTATIWNITAANTGTLTGGFSFTVFQNGTSGGGGDRFQFADQATLSGTLTGGGSDTLEYGLYSTSVIVDLQTGDDTGVAGGVSGIANVLGGTGNGSQGAYNLLIGNGANTLTGGTGRRNILVAGGSASTLNSGDQEDLLIGGTTTYDSDPALAAWLQIAAYWAGTDDFATRVANVLSGNGVPILDPTPQTGTVVGNGGGNTMNGTGALALIFSDGLDTILGFDPSSPIVSISP